VAAAGEPLGRYLVYDRIGRGGTASVHIARLVGLGGFSRVVALKKLHDYVAREPKFVAMLLDEARLMSHLRHPNVVPILDTVEDGASIALVMEYVAGASLSEIMVALAERGESFPLRIAVALVVNVLHGLHAAHEVADASGRRMGIVHRDATPHNVLIGSDGVARILDFGVAQARSRLQVTQTGEMKGKIAYMSPEQVSGGALDQRSDVFTIGIVLWELLTHTRLFFMGSDPASVQAVLSKPVVPPLERGVAPEAEALNEIVLRALERDVSRRLRSCDELAVMLEDAVSLPKPREVAAWLKEVAGDRLREREALVRQIESLELPEPPPSSRAVSRLLDEVAQRSSRRSDLDDGPTAQGAHRTKGPVGWDALDRQSAVEPIALSAPTSSKRRRPVIRKVRASLDSAVTQLRSSAKAQIDEIRRLYAAGEITTALARAESVRCPVVLSPDTILETAVEQNVLAAMPLDSASVFVFSRVDGVSDVEDILSVAGMPRAQVFMLLEKLVTVGALSVASSRSENEPTDIDTVKNGDEATKER
jgi:serine/threonine protein kinase